MSLPVGTRVGAHLEKLLTPAIYERLSVKSGTRGGRSLIQAGDVEEADIGSAGDGGIRFVKCVLDMTLFSFTGQKKKLIPFPSHLELLLD